MNGMDDLFRKDLGGDIHNTNPAEELSLLSTPGKFYGYPYCWAEWQLGKFGHGVGTMWAHKNTMNDGIHTDQWCQDRNNVEPPTYSLPAHNAPMEIIFWYGESFGPDFQGDAFVSLHGSWNREPPVGYRILRVHFNNGMPQEDSVFFSHEGAPLWDFRPVGLTWSPSNCGVFGECLFTSSDNTGEIVFIRRVGGNTENV
eukprot:TRINITY_DN5024_c0_g2_i2.p1 TRINITY_DN5024_c0_g2~~TRINITY_DN5024_c0_g2_i2.p1  ORF type:complete len:199 (-),score=34.12 TRINITY_DN5024_c0_g2_i2:114-710(-)